jgi:hypothetical protein
VLIPSHYATSPRTRSLRPVRVPSDQNTRWRLPFHFRPIDDKNFLSPHICQISLHFRFKVGIILFRRDAAHVRQPSYRLNHFSTCNINHNICPIIWTFKTQAYINISFLFSIEQFVKS